MRQATEVLRVTPQTKDRFLKNIGYNLTANEAMNILLNTYIGDEPYETQDHNEQNERNKAIKAH